MRAAVVVLACLPCVAFGYSVELLKANGPPEQKIDLVILGDGYRAQDQAQLADDARRVMADLFNATPWKQYESLFNVRLVHVVSNQNGADRGSFGANRDTALGAYFFCGDVERLICLNYGDVAQVLADHAPDYDVTLIVVNDPKYGGSGGAFPVTSIDPTAPQIVVHELGHTVGGLADEYESPVPGFGPCGTECIEANATKNATASVKWSAWLPSSTPIPTPEGDPAYTADIGVFEGCRYEGVGVFRPKDETCMMRSLGEAYCAVCADQMTKSFWNRVPSMFDAVSPANGDVGQVCGDVQLSVVLPPGPAYQFAWFVDGGVVGGTGSTFTFTPGPETAEVTVRVRDNTALVRSDPGGILDDSVSWTIQGGGNVCQLGLCDVSAVCEADGGCTRTFKDAGEPCGVPSCSSGALTTIGTCDGFGGCTGAPTSELCGAYACDDASAACKTQCGTAADCAVGFECGNQVCFVDAGSPPVQETPDAGSPVITPPREVTLPVAVAEGPEAARCGCNASGAPLFLLMFAAAALRRRRY